jgi:hypothetical protein
VFGLIALLAWLGPVGSAEAGLTFNRAALSLAGADLTPGLDQQLSGTAERPPAEQEGQRRSPLPRADHLPADAAHHGTSAPPGPSSGQGPGASLACLASPSCWGLAPDAGRRLYLADERFKPPSFASRLFRPPR